LILVVNGEFIFVGARNKSRYLSGRSVIPEPIETAR
jgi:hypothetical protein